MKYLMLIYAPTTPGQAPEPDCVPEDWETYHKAVVEAGILVDGAALADLVTATSVRVGPGGERTVTDGPFAETRELIGGYYVIDVPDLDVALDWAARCPGSWGGGGIEVRPIADVPQG